MPAFITELTDGQETYWIFFYIFSTAPTWLVIILASVVSILPDVVLKVIENMRENYSIMKAKQEEAARARKMNMSEMNMNPSMMAGFTLSQSSGSESSAPADSMNFDTNASLLNHDSVNHHDVKVRVFYIPTEQSQVHKTQVREEDLASTRDEVNSQQTDFKSDIELIRRKKLLRNQQK